MGHSYLIIGDDDLRVSDGVLGVWAYEVLRALYEMELVFSSRRVWELEIRDLPRGMVNLGLDALPASDVEALCRVIGQWPLRSTIPTRELSQFPVGHDVQWGDELVAASMFAELQRVTDFVRPRLCGPHVRTEEDRRR